MVNTQQYFRNLPDGCGEQNLVNVVMNIVALDYLSAVNKSTTEFNNVKKEAAKFIEIGVQKQLNYKHNDGSFSVWGKNGESGSTWLTAFVAKSFRQASKHTFVESNIIEKALQFLSQTQREDGSFMEVGYVFQKDIQGGSSNGIALTAYILITFLENSDYTEKFSNTIAKSLNFLSENFNNITNNHSLAIVTYAFQLALPDDDTLRNASLSILENIAIREGETMHWEENAAKFHENSFRRPNSLDIETTAYALHAYVQAGRLTDASRIMKWLVSQRNENGGFVSTQDTAVGLSALSKLAAKIYSPTSNLNVMVRHSNNQFSELHVNKTNALVLLKTDMPSSARSFHITAKGQGLGIFQISCRYNIDPRADEPHKFNITAVIVDQTIDASIFSLTVCVNYIPDNTSVTSNMVALEVDYLSGYTFDKDFTSTLESTREYKV